jgi:cytochrome c553
MGKGSYAMTRTMLILAIVATFGAMETAWAGGDVKAGQAKATELCADCHGEKGEGMAKNPALKGKTEELVAQALKDYKSGARDDKMMKKIAGSLSDQDMANLAAYYATLK